MWTGEQCVTSGAQALSMWFPAATERYPPSPPVLRKRMGASDQWELPHFFVLEEMCTTSLHLSAAPTSSIVFGVRGVAYWGGVGHSDTSLPQHPGHLSLLSLLGVPQTWWKGKTPFPPRKCWQLLWVCKLQQ